MFCVTLTMVFFILHDTHQSRFVIISSSFLYLFQNIFHGIIRVIGSYILKGHCHTIWQLYKKPEGILASLEFQN